MNDQWTKNSKHNGYLILDIRQVFDYRVVNREVVVVINDADIISTTPTVTVTAMGKTEVWLFANDTATKQCILKPHIYLYGTLKKSM